MSESHPCAVTTARFVVDSGPAKGATVPLRIDLISDQQTVRDLALSLFDASGLLHPNLEDVTVLLDRYEVEALRDSLTAWLANR